MEKGKITVQNCRLCLKELQKSDALIICDNRLVTRDYGGVFLASLPPIPRTRDLNIVQDFLEQK